MTRLAETAPPFPYPIKAVILDYGEVISHPADPKVISWMAQMFGVQVQGFRQTYGQFRHDYDRGTLSAIEYWTNVGEANGIHPSAEQIDELRKADVRMWSRLNQSVLDWVLELREAGFKTAVLSNMHDDMVQHLRTNGEWTKRFDVVTLSSSLGTAKPEPEIFEHCLNGLGVTASEAIFIDDREANIEGALRVGLSGIVAPTTEALVTMLEAMGFSPVPKL